MSEKLDDICTTCQRCGQYHSIYVSCKPPKKHKLTRCKYCGATLTRDCVGLRCPTHNCQWEWGIPKEAE
jgi:hypothetical protein